MLLKKCPKLEKHITFPNLISLPSAVIHLIENKTKKTTDKVREEANFKAKDSDTFSFAPLHLILEIFS